jgi:hypothetical protein
MKAILTLALIVLAANAQPIDPTQGQGEAEAYLSGLTGGLGFTSSQIEDGQNCFEAIKNIAQQLSGLLQNNQGSAQVSQSSEGPQGPPGFEGTGSNGGFDGTGSNGGFDGTGSNGGFDGTGSNGGFDGTGSNGGFDGTGSNGGFDGTGSNGGFDGTGSNGGFDGTGSNGGYEGPSGSQGPNIENVISSLLSLYGQAKNSILGECQPLLIDIQSVLIPNFENPSLIGLGEDTPFDEILSVNWNFYFPQIIKQVGLWVQQLHDGQFEAAGSTQAYIIKILVGSVIPKADATTSIPLGKSVAFNKNNFFTQFFTGFFKSLGGFKAADITTNIKSLSTCYDALNKISTQVTNFQTQTSNLSPLDAFYATKGFASAFASNIRGCKAALQLVKDLSGRFAAKVISSQDEGLYQIFLNLSLNFAQIETSLMTEASFVDQGKYELAGNAQANILKTILAKVIAFPL